MASVQGKSARCRRSTAIRAARGCSQVCSSSSAISFSIALAGTSMLFGSMRSAQSPPTTLGDLRAVPVAADDQARTSSSISSPSGRTALGSSIRISSANDSALPLCGVALARMSASVRLLEQPREPVVLRRVVGDVVRLVDDDGVPVLLLEVGEVAVALERVDRDDRPLEVGERVAVGRQLLPDPLDADRVEANERQGEAGPELELHLLQDVPRGDDQDPLAPAAAYELGQDHPDLDGLAEADRVGEQDPRAEVLRIERLAHGGELVGQRSRRGPGSRPSSVGSVSGTAVLRSVASSHSRDCR